MVIVGEIATLPERGNRLGDVPSIVPDHDHPRLAAASSQVEALEAGPGPDFARQLAAAWRRLASWAKAGELAAIAEFLDRRAADYGEDSRAMDAAMAEVQCALGYLTNAAIGRLAPLAQTL